MDTYMLLQQFLEKANNLLSRRFAGMNTIGGLPNVTDAQKQLAYQLHQDIFAFAEAYKGQPPDHGALWAAAQRIEGGFMAAQAMNAITEAECKTIVEQLYDLVERN